MILNKPLILALLISLSFNGLFGYLSYTFYSKKAVVESQLTQLKTDYKSLESSMLNQETACKIQEEIVSDFIEEKGVLDQKEKDILTEIDKLPSKPIKQDKPKREDNVQENNVAGLDDALPVELVRMLKQSFDNSIQR
jgi:hypothetical protein